MAAGYLCLRHLWEEISRLPCWFMVHILGYSYCLKYIMVFLSLDIGKYNIGETMKYGNLIQLQFKCLKLHMNFGYLQGEVSLGLLLLQPNNSRHCHFIIPFGIAQPSLLWYCFTFSD